MHVQRVVQTLFPGAVMAQDNFCRLRTVQLQVASIQLIDQISVDKNLSLRTNLQGSLKFTSAWRSDLNT